MVATADEMHDLEVVTVLDHHVRQRRARHDLHVALHRDLLGHEPQFGREFGEAQPGGDALVLAVDGDRDGAIGMGHGCVIHYTAKARLDLSRAVPVRNGVTRI